MKPKTNQTGDMNASKPFDRCQTPNYALAPLLPHLNRDWLVWEPAAGEGNIVNAVASHVRAIIGTDILQGSEYNFFNYEPLAFSAIVTNPPYSVKYEWLERCYALGRPFALLVPVEAIGAAKAQRLMERHGAELLLLDRRVNFKMPNKGWEGSAAQFPVLWLCWKILPAPIVYGKLPRQASGTAEQTKLDLLEAA